MEKAEWPRIAIVMAVYEPRMDWLREQLMSLNTQTYPNLFLYIRDDCSPNVPISAIELLVRRCIVNFPWTIRKNEKNIGSRKTFERLTQEAEGAYIAYCDQDDIWKPEKLTVLQQEIERNGALLVCSDVEIIDGNGEKTADSITEIRRHHRFHSGRDLAEGLLLFNFAMGCTMLVSAQEAKAAVPFCPYMEHDHYLALWCASRGVVQSLPQRLIRYRVHGGNQTGLLAGVTDRDSYARMRIDEPLRRMEWLAAQFPCSETLRRAIEARRMWMQARQDNWNHRGGACGVFAGRAFSPIPSLFELLFAHMPQPMIRAAIWCGKKNWI